MSDICTCGLLKVRKAGTSLSGGVDVCNNCGRPLEHNLENVKPVATEEAFKVSEREGERERLASLIGPRAQHQRTYRMIDNLAKDRKYRLALEGERFAAFSVIGTEDWQDYASLSLQAMQAESAIDLDVRVEQLTSKVDAIASHLARIVILLEQRADREALGDRPDS